MANNQKTTKTITTIHLNNAVATTTIPSKVVETEVVDNQVVSDRHETDKGVVE